MTLFDERAKVSVSKSYNFQQSTLSIVSVNRRVNDINNLRSTTRHEHNLDNHRFRVHIDRAAIALSTFYFTLIYPGSDKCSLSGFGMWDTTEWQTCKTELAEIGKLNTPCLIKMGQNDKKVIVCGFCESSEKTYAAVVYTRVEHEGEIHVEMIASKTRIAPNKSKLTLPQVELCGERQKRRCSWATYKLQHGVTR